MVVWIRFRVEFPHMKHSIIAAGDESCIVFEPSNTLHSLDMTFKLELDWTFCGVELVDPD